VVTFNFAASPVASYTTGKVFDGSDGAGGVQATAYGKTGGTLVAAPNTGGPGIFTGDLNLFAVTEGVSGNNASGIAPLTGALTSSPFTSEAGITETHILLLKLDGISAGSTIALLMQASYTGRQFNVYKFDSATLTPTGVGSGGASPMGLITPAAGINIDVGGDSTPTTYQYSFAKTAATGSDTEWIAIQADCNYILLDALSVTTPGAVPEPRFYSLLLTGLLGLAPIIRRRFVAQQ
jgi:hypothetical protein